MVSDHHEGDDHVDVASPIHTCAGQLNAAFVAVVRSDAKSNDCDPSAHQRLLSNNYQILTRIRWLLGQKRIKWFVVILFCLVVQLLVFRTTSHWRGKLHAKNSSFSNEYATESSSLSKNVLSDRGHAKTPKEKTQVNLQAGVTVASKDTPGPSSGPTPSDGDDAQNATSNPPRSVPTLPPTPVVKIITSAHPNMLETTSGQTPGTTSKRPSSAPSITTQQEMPLTTLPPSIVPSIAPSASSNHPSSVPSALPTPVITAIPSATPTTPETTYGPTPVTTSNQPSSAPSITKMRMVLTTLPPSFAPSSFPSNSPSSKSKNADSVATALPTPVMTEIPSATPTRSSTAPSLSSDVPNSSRISASTASDSGEFLATSFTDDDGNACCVSAADKEDGFVGVKSNLTVPIEYQYELEINSFVGGSLKHDICPAIKCAIIKKLVPDIFAGCESHRPANPSDLSSFPRRISTDENVVGVGTFPADRKGSGESCQYGKTTTSKQCDVLYGGITLFLGSSGANAQLEENVERTRSSLVSIKRGMEKDEFVNAHGAIEKIYFVDASVRGISPLDAESGSGSLVFVAVSSAALAFLCLFCCVKWQQHKKGMNDDDDSQSSNNFYNPNENLDATHSYEEDSASLSDARISATSSNSSWLGLMDWSNTNENDTLQSRAFSDWYCRRYRTSGSASQASFEGSPWSVT